MKITFLGAAGTVTGSSYVLTSGSGQSIMIDLGMFQGLPEIDKLNYEPFEYDCSKLIGMVLTHAHLDHCGRLPIILPKGFTESIYMTDATRELTELSLLDTAKIAVQDNKPILFDKDQAYQAFSHFKPVQYRAPFQVGDFTITFRDAGHILGAASVEIEDNNPDSAVKKIIFSGDLGNSPEDIVRETELLESADAVVMESTYGDRLHPESDPMETLQSEINAVEKTGGTLLIPAFALERTQELLHMIMHLKKSGKIMRPTPVYMDSPMAKKATDVYKTHRELYNAHLTEDMAVGDPFEFSRLEIVDKRSESQGIYHQKGAKVIIAGSGMMAGGRILGHAEVAQAY
ncbi:MBL fold metallo-hydrolase [Candidatus Microgenomates bacterium]|nr:MBL fold metallo-hydrolase [Candidatus Microgenomates bacterium]